MATAATQQLQPQSQTAGTNLSPLTPNTVNSPLVATVPTTPSAPGTTGVGASDPGLVVPTGISQGISTVGGSKTVLGDFQQTYGQGTGTALENTLAGLGTATSGAVTATNAGILDAASKQYANIQATQAAHGVSADSSTAALAAGDFNAGVNQNIASTDAGMQLSEENELISALQGEGTAHGTDESTMQSVMNGISDATSIAGSVGGAIAGGGFGGALGNVGDILSGL